MQTAVLIDHVVKEYGDKRAVDALSLSIPQGSVYGFIGPNGAGKTTTLRMIMKILYPDSGSIEILGVPYSQEFRHRVGYMPEERGVYTRMRVRDAAVFMSRLKGMDRVGAQQRVDKWLERMGLAEWKLKKVQDLSKGMQQKLQFIATVSHDPELVILDEPFSGLDPINTELLTAIIGELRQQGRTVIFSTHVMEQAEKLCDRIFLINKGRKLADGPLDELKQRHATNEVIIDVVAGAPPPNLPGVIREGDHWRMALKPGQAPQELLRELVTGGVQVAQFKRVSPSLHSIFISLVEADR